MTSFAVGTFTEQFSKDQAVRYLEDGVIVFFAGGTGHPYFSTDTGIVLRAVETEADMILMAKNVDGVYDSDPAKNPDAKRFDHLTYEEVVERNLQAVDMTSSVLAKENGRTDADSLRQCYYMISKREYRPAPLTLESSPVMNYDPNLSVYDELMGGEIHD